MKNEKFQMKNILYFSPFSLYLSFIIGHLSSVIFKNCWLCRDPAHLSTLSHLEFLGAKEVHKMVKSLIHAATN